MLNSLRVRLLFAMLLVGLVTMGTVAIYASRTTSSQFQQYLARDEENFTSFVKPLIINRIQAYLNQFNADDTFNMDERSAECLQDILNCEEFDHRGFQDVIIQLGRISNSEVIVVGNNNVIVGDSSNHLVGTQPNPGDLTETAGVVVIQDTPFLVYIHPLSGDEIGPAEKAFLESVNRSLAIAGVVAVVAALALGLLLSQSILQPLQALTSAAGRIAQGDLQQRVDVEARGEIGVLANSFNEMAAALAHLEQLRRNMVTDIAHELRTPLSNIRGYLEALQDGLLEAAPETITLLHEEALQLNRLINDLQELSLAEAGQLKLILQPFDPVEAIENAVQIAQPQARQKELSIQFHQTQQLPPVYGDRGRILQVLGNLLSNAIRHTSAGGTITISAQDNTAHIAIQVQDTGDGIDPKELPYIFERFYRPDFSRSRATGGAGLGLAIVKQLVHAHGGRIEAASTSGEGACFTFTLPIHKPQNQE